MSDPNNQAAAAVTAAAARFAGTAAAVAADNAATAAATHDQEAAVAAAHAAAAAASHAGLAAAAAQHVAAHTPVPDTSSANLLQTILFLQEKISRLEAQATRSQPRNHQKALHRPSVYKGERDPAALHTFIERLHDFIAADPATTPQEAAAITFSCLEGEAATWFSRWRASRSNATLVDICDALRERFTPLDAVRRAWDQIASLRQGKRSAAALIEDFDRVASSIPLGPGVDDQLVGALSRCLNPHYRLEVRRASLQQLFTRDALTAYFLDLDDIFQDRGAVQGAPAASAAFLSRGHGPTPMEGIEQLQLDARRGFRGRQQLDPSICRRCRGRNAHRQGCKSTWNFGRGRSSTSLQQVDVEQQPESEGNDQEQLHH